MRQQYNYGIKKTPDNGADVLATNNASAYLPFIAIQRTRKKNYKNILHAFKFVSFVELLRPFFYYNSQQQVTGALHKLLR